jgi:hypothetical protein
MRYVLALLASLISCVAQANECNSSCTFIRGDANCSGTLTVADVSAISSGYFSNADAADVNDDGSVTGADAAQLSYWIFSGPPNPPPHCPFPTAGKDCTPDALENCCSPPTNSTTALTYRNCTVTIDDNNWDHHSEAGYDSGNKCYGYGHVSNDAACDPEHDNSHADMDVAATVTDPPGFTKRRLDSGVQRAFLHGKLEAWFAHGARCLDHACYDTNFLWAQILENTFDVDIHVKPASGGSGSDVVYNDSWVEYEWCQPCN